MGRAGKSPSSRASGVTDKSRGGPMHRWIGILLLLAPLGCFTPVTSRLDQTNMQMESMRDELARTNATLDDAKKHMANIEKLMEQTNKQLKPLERFAKPFGLEESEAPVVAPPTRDQCWAG